MRQEPRHGLAVGKEDSAYKNARVTPLDPIPICQLVPENKRDFQFISVPQVSVQARLVYHHDTSKEVEVVEDDKSASSSNNGAKQQPMISTLQESGFIAPIMDRHEECLFVFSELGIRDAGEYRIRFDLIDRVGLQFKRLASIYSQPFTVVGDRKDFVGLQPSSTLVHALVRRGLKLRIINTKGTKKASKKRKKEAGSGGTGGEDDGSSSNDSRIAINIVTSPTGSTPTYSPTNTFLASRASHQSALHSLPPPPPRSPRHHPAYNSFSSSSPPAPKFRPLSPAPLPPPYHDSSDSRSNYQWPRKRMPTAPSLPPPILHARPNLSRQHSASITSTPSLSSSHSSGVSSDSSFLYSAIDQEYHLRPLAHQGSREQDHRHWQQLPPPPPPPPLRLHQHHRHQQQQDQDQQQHHQQHHRQQHRNTQPYPDHHHPLASPPFSTIPSDWSPHSTNSSQHRPVLPPLSSLQQYTRQSPHRREY
jgi:hypothetical protein